MRIILSLTTAQLQGQYFQQSRLAAAKALGNVGPENPLFFSVFLNCKGTVLSILMFVQEKLRLKIPKATYVNKANYANKVNRANRHI